MDVKELNGKQRHFAALVVSGVPAGRAYEQAGYTAKGHVADQAASRLLTNVKVKEHVDQLREEVRKSQIMSFEELEVHLAQAIRIPVGQVDQNSPFCQEYSVLKRRAKGSASDEKQQDLGLDFGAEDDSGGTETEIEGEGGVVVRVKSVDKLRAAALLIGMKGWNKQTLNVEGNLTLGNVLDQVDRSPFPGAKSE